MSKEPAHWKHWPEGVPHAIEVGDRNLWDAFEARATQAPGEIALHFLGRAFRWRDLLQQVLDLAGALQSLGVQRGDRVLLMSQNAPQYLMAFHAVVRCGAVVVPVNPMNKSGELVHYITDAGARLAIVAGDLACEMAQASNGIGAGQGLRHLVVFDLADAASGEMELPAAWQAWLGPRPQRPALAHGDVHAWSALVASPIAPSPVEHRPDDLVLLGYTSGTTGHPKGCMHTHRTLLHNALAAGPWYDMRPGDVSLIVVPMFHITGLVMGMIAAIVNGCSIVMLPRWDRAIAARVMATHRVTHWPNIPTMVIDLLGAPDLDRFDLASLRYIGGGGAAMPEAVATRLQAQFGLTYVEGYGLTETAAPTHTNPRHAARRQCLGIPWVSTQARVVDPETLTELPAGEVGEIVVRGPQLFQGYWQQPDATADAFVEIDGARWFRTGDLARVDADGYFHLADRLKRMINASGFKVWPAEVEALLHQHPGVHEACIIARRDPYRGETVKAVIVPRADWRDRLRADDIITWAREHMAAYKYPREIEFADTLPKSGSGKVMWRTLQDRQDASDAARPPAP